MATRVGRTRSAPPAAKTPARRAGPARSPTPSGIVDLSKRLEWDYVDITDIVPYELNARDNEKAVPAVANSIRAFGFLIPCVIDANNILVAGHTRVEAAKTLGMTEVPCVRAGHLTQHQIDQFRIVDNKVSEIATWDNDLLGPEISRLMAADTGLDFTNFGFTQETIDCLQETVAGDCLQAADTANSEIAASNNVQQRRAPTQARIVIGEFVFYVPATAYRSWADGVRARHDFSEAAIHADLKARLGILED